MTRVEPSDPSDALTLATTALPRFHAHSEKGASYDPSRFGGAVSAFRFADHNPPPLALLHAVTADMDAWLAADERNVVAVHCKVRVRERRARGAGDTRGHTT